MNERNLKGESSFGRKTPNYNGGRKLQTEIKETGTTQGKGKKEKKKVEQNSITWQLQIFPTART